MKVAAIIPARAGSRRLEGKNTIPVAGRPLLGWAVRAALGSRFIGPGNVYVSTEDLGIAEIAAAEGATPVIRPPELAGDDVWTEPVIRHAVEEIERASGKLDVVVWMNACLPEIVSQDVDACVDRLLHDGLREVIAIDGTGRSHSAVRALTRAALDQRRLSVDFATVVLNYVDVHTRDDVELVERRLRSRREKRPLVARADPERR